MCTCDWFTDTTSLFPVNLDTTAGSRNFTDSNSGSGNLPIIISVIIVTILVAVIVILVAIVVITNAPVRKMSHDGTGNEIYDDIAQFNSLTNINPAYSTPAAQLTTNPQEMELAQNDAYTPTIIPVDPNVCYSSVKPTYLNTTGESTSQQATTEEYDYVIP